MCSFFRKKQFDRTKLGEKVLACEDGFIINLFSCGGHVKIIFDQMVNFKSVIGFLFDLRKLNALDEMKVNYKKIILIFTKQLSQFRKLS